MGFKTEFNWALKLTPDQGLDEKTLEINGIYGFSKHEYRVYPIGMPIDLINKDWEAVAKVIILESNTSEGKTTGKYKVIKIYEGLEKEILTNYWRETIQFVKGVKVVKGAKIT